MAKHKRLLLSLPTKRIEQTAKIDILNRPDTKLNVDYDRDGSMK